METVFAVALSCLAFDCLAQVSGPGLWEHRLYLGADAIALPHCLVTNRVCIGALPSAGQRISLGVPASEVELLDQDLAPHGRAIARFRTNQSPSRVEDAG